MLLQHHWLDGSRKFMEARFALKADIAIGDRNLGNAYLYQDILSP